MVEKVNNVSSDDSLNESIPSLLARLWRHVRRRRKVQFVFLVGLMLLNAVAQAFSLGAVLPFLSVMVAPEVTFNYPIVAEIASAWGITSAEQLVLPFTVMFVVAALIAGAIQMSVLWASSWLAVVSGSALSIEVYRRSLYQPYIVHASRNSSEVISAIINKVNDTVFGVLFQILTLISSGVLMIAIILTLLAIDPLVASVTAATFGTSYVLITLVLRRQFLRNSELIAHKQTQVVKSLQEGLGGIRDVLLDGTQPLYCEIYRKADVPLRRAQGKNVFFAGSPRPAMEALGISLIAILAYTLSLGDKGLTSALPTLGVIALSAQRLLPALQQVFSSWANISGNKSQLADTIDLLDQPVQVEQLEHSPEPLIIQSEICFKDVRFRYNEGSPWILDGFNLTIPRGATVGFVGSTGSGKSTTLDLLMGLLMPTQGELLVDGQLINGDQVRAWQKSIAHVPQNIYLADTDLAQNIAFGMPSGSIDMVRVRQAASEAQIDAFIESQSKGYKEIVGEQGIRLSGGQRQRIGIARALYKKASVLVLDEATSALDNATEQMVMDTISELNSDLTILIIAHRLTTVRRCDFIVEMEHGRVVATGTYDQLLESSSSFRKLAIFS